jgi:hypothetical protein
MRGTLAVGIICCLALVLLSQGKNLRVSFTDLVSSASFEPKRNFSLAILDSSRDVYNTTPTSSLYTSSSSNKKYLFYYTHAGFSNQLIALQHAMQLAHSTNRTVIVPPLLPHRGNKSKYAFDGRNGKSFQEAVDAAVEDIKTVMSMKGREEYPSWTEVFDYDAKATGVNLIDLYDFVKDDSYNMHNMLNKTTIMDGVDPIKNGGDWNAFVRHFNQHFGNQTLAIIGSAYNIQIDAAFATHDEDAAKRIHQAVHSFTPSIKVINLLRAAFSYMPEQYVGVHIRFGDLFWIKHCNDSAVVEGYTGILRSLNESNVTNGTSIFIGSKDGRAKGCLEELSNHSYDVYNMNDLFEASAAATETNVLDGNTTTNHTMGLQQAMDDLHLDLGTKHLLLDYFLVALGVPPVFFARISFRPSGSTFQELIDDRNKHRVELLNRIRGIS